MISCCCCFEGHWCSLACSVGCGRGSAHLYRPVYAWTLSKASMLHPYWCLDSSCQQSFVIDCLFWACNRSQGHAFGDLNLSAIFDQVSASERSFRALTPIHRVCQLRQWTLQRLALGTAHPSRRRVGSELQGVRLGSRRCQFSLLKSGHHCLNRATWRSCGNSLFSSSQLFSWWCSLWTFCWLALASLPRLQPCFLICELIWLDLLYTNSRTRCLSWVFGSCVDLCQSLVWTILDQFQDRKGHSLESMSSPSTFEIDRDSSVLLLGLIFRIDVPCSFADFSRRCHCWTFSFQTLTSQHLAGMYTQSPNTRCRCCSVAHFAALHLDTSCRTFELTSGFHHFGHWLARGFDFDFLQFARTSLKFKAWSCSLEPLDVPS